MRNWKRILVAVTLFAIGAAMLTGCEGNWTGGPVTIYGGANVYAIANHGPAASCGTVPTTVTITPTRWYAPDPPPNSDQSQKKQTQADATRLGFDPATLGIAKVPSGFKGHSMKYNLHAPCNGAEDPLWVDR